MAALARLLDGGIVIYDVDLHEPIGAQVTADALQPTVDALQPTADGGLLAGASELADAVVNANFVFAEIFEPIAVPITTDSLWPTADHVGWGTADGGLLEGARDTLDAERISKPAVGGGGWFDISRPLMVVGYGFGILPQLEGEAHGTVGVAGQAAVTVPIAGAAMGEVEDDDALIELLLLTLAA